VSSRHGDQFDDGVPPFAARLAEEAVDRVLVLAEEPDLRDLSVPEVTEERVVAVERLVAALVVRELEADAVLVVGQVRVRCERVRGWPLQEPREQVQELILPLVHPRERALPWDVDHDVVGEVAAERLYVAPQLRLVQVA
jgi:hypothetical protein